MNEKAKGIDVVRVSRAGHSFHERWAARRALQLVFPKDNLFAIVIEGLSPNEHLNFGQEAEDIADLVLYYGCGDTFDTCETQQILQFKYKEAAEPVTSSYLKKTIKKFSATLRNLRACISDDILERKLSFGFVTNARFTDELWDAIACLKSGKIPESNSAQSQFNYLKDWCQEESVVAEDIFKLIEFRAATDDLPTQSRLLRRTVSDWSADSSGLAAKRLLALVELIREKSQIEGQGKNSIRREDILNILECDEEQLFPADTRFVDVGNIVDREVLQDIKCELESSNIPLFIHADGGVGKTIFIQSLAAHLKDTFEVVVFDCFGGGAYRSETQARHLPRVGLLQIVNELAARGLCDPLFPTDSDQYGLVKVARHRFTQARETIKNQSSLQGVLIILDAADNAQLEAEARSETSFPRLLLASLSEAPIEGVKLLLTARPHRMEGVIGTSQTKRYKLEPFTKEEAWSFLEARRENITDVEFSTAFSRSKGNARVLEYLVESWDLNVAGGTTQSEISVEELIEQKCGKIFRDLHMIGWNTAEIREFFAALSLLPPPIPLVELAEALGWPESQVNSAASDLAPMLELVTHGAIFRDEPTETYIKDHYASEVVAQQAIAQRLLIRQKSSMYAAEALPFFLEVIGDSDRAYQLASSDEFPSMLETEHSRRRLRLSRLYAAFSLATRDENLDRLLSLTMQLSQVASANARGDQYIRNSPALATILGDSDVSRRLFNDRSGWQGARDTRLIVAYSFTAELDEARIHQNRAIGWINWYLHHDDDTERLTRSGPEASDIAAVMFLNVLQNEFASFNKNMKIWNLKFSLSVIEELIKLCVQHEAANGSKVLQTLVEFAVSKVCLSLPLHIGLLSNECGLSRSQLKAVSSAMSLLTQRRKEKLQEDHSDYKMGLQAEIARAAMDSLIVNSKQSAQRLHKLYLHRRPSSYDYGERYGANRIWAPVQSACITAWSVGKRLAIHHLLPEGLKIGIKAKSITSEADLRDFLDDLTVTRNQVFGQKSKKQNKCKQFSQHEREDIVKGITCILQLVEPVEDALQSNIRLSNDVLAEFLSVWKFLLRPNVHWRAKTGKDNVVRHVGTGLVKILLRHCEIVDRKEVDKLIEIIDSNGFQLSEKLEILAIIARRSNLSDVVGSYAAMISSDIIKDDYIEQRGELYQKLAESLLPMSIGEARAYYAQGLLQLDQMGGDDSDLIDSILHYAAKQPGGFIKPELSHRLMNLCHTIFQHEPSKFGWTLFGRAVASSIGFSAIYKLIRWDDQDVVDFSYGLPQIVCYLAKEGHLDARRASVFLSICEDMGWYDWQVGTGLSDLLVIANPKDRATIFSIVAEKLDQEHTLGGGEGLWDSLLSCVNNIQEIRNENLIAHLLDKRNAARRRCDAENTRYNYKQVSIEYNDDASNKDKKEQASKEIIAAIVARCDVTSVSSVDTAIQEIQACDELSYGSRSRLLEALRGGCPYDKRVKYLEALCESVELEFDQALDHIIECLEAWSSSSVYVTNSIPSLIQLLFLFKGSELFTIRYSSISKNIDRLSKLCGNPKFVLRTVLATVVKEHLELEGREWLQLATSLSCHCDPLMALGAFESLLSSSAAKLGDEIGEGSYCAAFSGKSDESNVLADIIWHLLGDSDAVVRWNTARSLKWILDAGLTEDIGNLLERFDTVSNLSLSSDGYYFSYLNAQQWLLMGLARAALHHGEKLKPLYSKLVALAERTDLHVIHKLHLFRCLQKIEGDRLMSPLLSKLWEEIHSPLYGIVERDGRQESKKRQINLDFEYEFDKSEISSVAELFGISHNEAGDYIAAEVLKLWPNALSISELPGGISYRGDERFETYAEHIQRHARLFAVTKLVNTLPVAKQNYYQEDLDPWQEFLQREDISFNDGSWLSDHKDTVPPEAQELLLGERKGNKDALLNKEILFKKIGLPHDSNGQFLPLYGYWTSPDGVNVRICSALIDVQGAVGQCSNFSKSQSFDFWLPKFDSNGCLDRYADSKHFKPLIWEPKNYPIGIDESDELAARIARYRPKIGVAISKLLGLTSDDDERLWHDRMNRLVLKSEVWGKWKSDPDDHRRKYQDDGTILWANQDLLEIALESNKLSLVYTLEFSKYKSSRSHDESSRIKEKYVILKKGGYPLRFWYAKKASKTL
ncbi:hypothetical protein [Aeromonas veronii]|uniref:hypothetical protein n=1 Tax=Aeromonas veronii TaxID=654 RepID=UPI003BA025BC